MLPEHRVPPARKGRKARRVCRAQPVPLALKARRVFKAFRALKVLMEPEP